MYVYRSQQQSGRNCWRENEEDVFSDLTTAMIRQESKSRKKDIVSLALRNEEYYYVMLAADRSKEFECAMSIVGKEQVVVCVGESLISLYFDRRVEKRSRR